jgi:hypothetical protein
MDVLFVLLGIFLYSLTRWLIWAFWRLGVVK